MSRILVKCKYDKEMNVNGARCISLQGFNCRKLRPRALWGDCNQSFFVDWVQFIVLRKHLIPMERMK